MNICETVRCYGTHRIGGMPLKAQVFSEALVALGHRVIVLTTGMNNNDKQLITNTVNGVEIYYLDCPSQKYTTQWWNKSNEKFQELHEMIKFDVLHSESYSGKDIKTTIPRIATLHGVGAGLVDTYLFMSANGYDVNPTPIIAKYIDEVSQYKDFDLLLGVSKKEQRLLNEMYRLKRPAQLLYNPVNPIFFHYNWEGKEDYYFAYGMTYPEKGSRNLQNLSKKLKILYAGSAPPGGRVEYLGALGHEAIAKYLAECRGLINPTLCHQGFDLTICEAMAVGTPVFAPHYYVDEDLIDKTHCFYFDPTDTDKAITTINLYSKNDELCTKVSREAKFFAINNFDIKKVVTQFTDIVSKMVDK